MVTCPGEVCFNSWSAALTRNDMFAVESKERVPVLMRPAVFAAIRSSIADEIAAVHVRSNSLICPRL